MDQRQVRAGLATRIRAGMGVFAADGAAIGTVARVDGDEIVLAGGDGAAPAMVPLSLVDAVEDERVTVRTRGDNAFGVEA